MKIKGNMNTYVSIQSSSVHMNADVTGTNILSLFCLVFREPVGLPKKRHGLQTATTQAHRFLSTGDYCTNHSLLFLTAPLLYCETHAMSLFPLQDGKEEQ